VSLLEAVEYSTDTKLDQLSINTFRTLSIDAVEQAKSGHPGTPMALAPLVYTYQHRPFSFSRFESLKNLVNPGTCR